VFVPVKRFQPSAMYIKLFGLFISYEDNEVL
jgi:hypothetical protein